MHYEPMTFALPENIPGLSPNLIATHLGLYEGYVKHVNVVLNELDRLATSPEENAYLISETRRRLGFEFSGMRLHELYFSALAEGVSPLTVEHTLFKALREQYHSFDQTLEVLRTTGARGPGWSLLLYDAPAKRFFNAWVADHEIGHLAGLPIVLAVDHWEHAFMPDYLPGDKQKYVDAYLGNINWEVIEKRFLSITGGHR